VTGPPPSLAGRAVLVAGGSGGLGAAVCRVLAGRGAAIAVSGRDPVGIAASVASARGRGGHVVGLPADLRHADEVEALVAATVDELGALDVLVAAAGVAGPAGVPSPVARTSLADWATVLDTNLRGVFLLCRAVYPHLRGRGGDIVTIVSARAGTSGHPFAAAYSASKLGVAALAHELATAGHADGIRVHALFPDAIDTALLTSSGVPGPRLAPERVASVVADLLDVPRDANVVDPVLASPDGPWPSTRRLEAFR
jgi:2-deoxy-D-gluconate 3-dehydrogenase